MNLSFSRFVRPTLITMALALFAIAGIAGGVCAQMPVLSPAQYGQALAKVAQAVQAQIDLENGGSSTRISDPQDALRPILHCQVRDPAGHSLITVDNLPLQNSISSVEDLSDPDDRLQGLKAILAQIHQIQDGLSHNPASQTDEASIRQVLSSAEFSSLPIPPPSRADRWMDSFGRWLDRLLSKIHGPSAPSGHINPRVPLFILGTILAVAAIILIALIVVAITRYIARSRATIAIVPASGLAMTAQEASLVATRDFERLLELARRHAEDGDHRSALRLAYLATLVLLDSEGVVRLNRSKTNWEYLRMVRNAGQEGVYTALLPFTRTFDRIWYGLRPAANEEFQEALGRYEEVRYALMGVPAQKEAAFAGA